jgi:putative nucleotidyltransferase with HDIG domain
LANNWLRKVFGGAEGSAKGTTPQGNGESAPKTNSDSTTAIAEDENVVSGTQTKGWWDAVDQMVDLADRAVIVASPVEAAIVQRINERLKSGKFQLPVLPNTLIQVIDHANRPEPNFKAIADCIRTDAIIAGEVMALVNSAAYAAAAPIKDLQRAIIHVGSKRIRSLALAVAARLTVFRNADQQRAERLWIHSLGAAVLSRAIARASTTEPEEAFLAGLLHDVGKSVVLGLLVEEERANPGIRVSDTLVDQLCDECHTGTGAAIAKLWNLHPQHIEAIEHHHSVRPFSPPLVAVAALANDVCGFLGIGVTQKKSNLARHPAFGILGLDREKATRLLQLLPAVLSEAPEFKGVVRLPLQKGDAGAP